MAPLPFRGSTAYGYVNGMRTPQIFWSVKLALAASDRLAQSNTNSKRQPLKFVALLARPLG